MRWNTRGSPYRWASGTSRKKKKKKTIQALFVSLQLSLFASWGNWNLTYLMNTTTLKYICDHFHTKMYYFIADNMPLKITLKASFNPELSIELIILLGVHVSQQMCNQTGCLISDITHFYTWSKLVWFQVVIEEHPVTSFHLAEPVWQPLTWWTTKYSCSPYLYWTSLLSSLICVIPLKVSWKGEGSKCHLF